MGDIYIIYLTIIIIIIIIIIINLFPAEVTLPAVSTAKSFFA
jgi:hypothetical protein